MRSGAISSPASGAGSILSSYNPPYLPTEPEERLDDWLEYALDGGKSGRETIERFAASVGDVLAPGGRILAPCPPGSRALGRSATCLAGTGLWQKEVSREVVEGEALVVLRITKKGASG